MRTASAITPATTSGLNAASYAPTATATMKIDSIASRGTASGIPARVEARADA